MIEGATGVFGPGREKTEGEDFERQRDELHAKIGQLTVEVDFPPLSNPLTYSFTAASGT